MLASIVLTLFTMLVAYATGAPLEANDAGSAVEVRSGSHSANIYSDWNCAGGTVLSVAQFGCGGQCYSFGRGSSILLQQAGTGNPKPTASLFSSNTCSGSHQSAGIFSGEHSGCTNSPSQGQWGSVYLYFDC